jgi:putative transcriptional regulator
MPDGANVLRILRDLRLSTKVLILYEMLREPGMGQRALADRLDVTPQAISEYLKHMEEEGLVEREGRSARPTMQGFSFLQGHLQELGDFTYRAMRELNVIRSCAAIAVEDVRGGDRVVLELRDGVITARKGGEGASIGVASHDASVGEDLAVRDLEGILTIETGSITVVSLPSAIEGGTGQADLKALRGRLGSSKHQVVATLDPVGLVAARKLKLEPSIRFAVDQGAVDAALRGLDVLVLGGRDSVGTLLEAVEAHNKRSDHPIEHSVIDVVRE